MNNIAVWTKSKFVETTARVCVLVAIGRYVQSFFTSPAIIDRSNKILHHLVARPPTSQGQNVLQMKKGHQDQVSGCLLAET